MPVIDLKKRLGIEQTPYTALSRIVTVIVGDLQVGMLVDSVTEVLTIRSRLVDPKKTVSDKAMEKFLSGIGNIDGRLVTMLNLEGVIKLADSTSVIMNLTTTTGKKSSKSITDVNPNASDGDIKNFVNGLNSITTDTIDTITKVSKSEIENVTYYDLTVIIEKINDSQSAITINGSTVDVDYSKIGDISNIFQMTKISIVSRLDNRNIAVSYYTETTGYMPGMFLDLSSPLIYITNTGESVGTGSTIIVHIKDGQYINGSTVYHYNGTNVTINFH